jgi:small subunit ribosomal protein S18
LGLLVKQIFQKTNLLISYNFTFLNLLFKNKMFYTNKSNAIIFSQVQQNSPLNYFIFLPMNFTRQRTSPIHAGEIISYKNVDLLRRFITEQGKILPRRLTGVTAKEQRQLAKAIKQARILGFLQFLYKE